MFEKNEELIDILESFLGDFVKHNESKSQITFNCPNCAANKGVESDGKGNLEVNYEMGVYNCWVCGEVDGMKGKIFSLVKKYSDAKTLGRFIGGNFEFNNDFHVNDGGSTKNTFIKLPNEFVELSEKFDSSSYIAPLNYLRSRRITDEMIIKYNIGFCSDGYYGSRIIIPSLDVNNTLNYFTSRTIKKKVKPKYIHPDVDKTNIIFNERFIDWDKTIFLVEGVFDHIVVPNSIPLQGKRLYEKLFNYLYTKANSYIIIALDPDAYGDAIKIYNKLDAGRLRNKILINKMNDPDDISSFNQKYGAEALQRWLKNKNIKIYI